MVVLKRQDLPRSDETVFLKLLQTLPEIYKTEHVEKAFSFFDISHKKLNIWSADGADAWGMDKYIERSKYGFFELRYVSENGSAGPDFPDLWRK